MKYYPFIDGLRGLAIALVVVFHFFPSVLPGGYIGVDVFFVISGFLITSIIWEKMQSGTFSFADFYAARIRRLAPAAFVMYAFTLIVGFFILMPEAYRELGRSLYKAITFLSNQYFYYKTGYFAGPSIEKPLLHTWSLSVEEQFYIIWPAILFLTSWFALKKQKQFVFLTCFVIFSISLVLSEYFAYTNANMSFYGLSSRAWELMLGASLALVVHKINFSKSLSEIFAVTGFVLIILSAFILNDKSTFPGLAALPVCLGTALVIASSLHNHTYISRWMTYKPVLFLGLISYSLYLWHWPLLSFAVNYLERPLHIYELVFVLMLSLLISILSWHYIESVFRRKNQRYFFSNIKAYSYSIGLIAVFLILGKGLYNSDGLVWRWDEKTRSFYETLAKQNTFGAKCEGYKNVFERDEDCNFGVKKEPGQSFDLAMIGDSKADHFIDMFQKFALEKNLSARQVTNKTCPPLLEMTVNDFSYRRYNECKNLQKQIIKFVETNPNLKVVVIAGNWGGYDKDNRNEFDDLGVSPELHDTVAKEGYQKGTFAYHLRLTIEFFLQKGIAVHLMGDIPDYKESYSVRCARIAYREGNTKNVNCEIPSDITKALQKSNDLFIKFSKELKNVSYYLPTKDFCDDTHCRSIIDGVFMYRDGNHLNSEGSRLLYKYATFPVIKK